MFRTNSNQDRMSYSSLLLPPPGFVLDQAVGTTYSLDLETLTAVSIALGLKEDMDSDLLRNPISMLNALQKVTEKILIFCEAGQMKASDKASPLMILMEKMVIPIALPKGRKGAAYPSFHPKTWVLRYVNSEGEKRYRFAVLSRNLTFDRSWDISFCMDSSDEILQPEKTAPIVGFLSYLRDRIGNTVQDFRRKRSTIKDFAEDLSQVSFALNDHEFGENFTVMPLGIGEAAYNIGKDPLLCQHKWSKDYSFQDLVVFSPFLSASLIEEWNRPEHEIAGTNRTLITRRSELPKLTADQTGRFKVYVLKDDIVEGEEYISEADADKQRQDIHAKIYLRRKYADTDLYLGSMNASFAATHQNVEMMIRLGTKNRYLNSDRFLRELFCGPADGKENPFEEVWVRNEKADDSEDEVKLLERRVKEICRRKMQAVITENNGKYDVRVAVSGEFFDEWKNVSIAPLRRNVYTEFAQEMVFPEMEILQLTEFFRIRIQGQQEQITRIIMIPTTGFPEDRENAVVNSVVKDKRSFIEYVAFVLGEDYLLTMLEERTLGSSGLWSSESGRMPALYEKMLKTALEEPERLKEIEYLLRMIEDKEIIPDEFRELYETFRTTLRLK
ncbi:MAG: phospholipase D family protein [Oscillospiraceae bacterium]|nr:phospholipase D family protein [Oscillospiraceae bacterium]